ncbi:MAG: PDZ domain-containing protein [candidate division Zixibacteria bacterium]|nr:PDZ domain-containing protein [candidate division Zixibacteria bacterium]
MRIVLTIIFGLAISISPAFGQGLQIFDDLQELIISVSEAVKPTVVHIEVVKKHNSQRYESLGSGLIVSDDGYIITNEHVVDKYVSVRVTLESKLEYPAEVIGTDKLTDIALLKIDVPPSESFKVARLGNSDSVQVGEWVLAVGNPYGFDRTVSFGIVSGKGRTLNLPNNAPLLNDFIQTDAAIDPGSSGGPLVNLRGEIIGINSIGVGRMQGFTIPINIAIDVMDKLLATGKIDRGYIGIVVQPLNRSYAKYYNQPDLQGIVIGDVFKDHPADKAGIKPGDIVTSFDGQELSAENEDDLTKFTLDISQSKIGEKKEVEIFRDGKTRKVSVKIGQKPKVKPDEYETELDFTVEEITEHMFRSYLLQSRDGVYVRYVEVGSPADKGNLYAGDVIIKVGDNEIKNLEDFKKTMQEIGEPEFLMLRVLRGKDFAFALLDFTETEWESE